VPSTFEIIKADSGQRSGTHACVIRQNKSADRLTAADVESGWSIMSYQAIVYDVRNHIGYVTLNRPQVLNAVNQQMRREIIDVCARMRADSEVRACIFTGAGERAFSTGFDLFDG
jgi:1,4-dihydroxy-2-naphthoyl-CoA synthase